jgi:Pyruvate/2-oxoacid:ferredoxin oxidoreductase delta subunit
VAEELGLSPADFTTGSNVSFPEGCQNRQFHIAQGVLDCDGMISLPKLKTHALIRLTGAVKNQFGCIPGMLKGEFHARMAELDRFAQMLVDLARCVRPRLYVMDAVTAMEGNGPGSGTPRNVGALLFSTDPVAMDTVACRLIGLPPDLLLTNLFGEEMGLGRCTDIEVVGDDVASLVVPDFKVDRRSEPKKGALQPLLARWFKSLATPRPVIDPVRCTRCGTCVKVCPVSPRAVDFRNGKEAPPSYDYDACIRCYCCQEMCPDKAISVTTPRLGRLIHRS